MRQVSLPVHPLSRRVLLCEYGAEPLVFPNHDFFFRLLTSGHLRNRSMRNAQKLTTRVSIMVDDALARHIDQNTRSVGVTLLSFHFQTLCRFADSALQLQGKGHVKAAIEQWLLLHKVDETEYAADTAYKLWQRHSWNLEKKNGLFFGRSRGKSDRLMSKKTRVYAKRLEPLDCNCMRLSEIEVELAVARFVSSLVACFRRPPKKIAEHARIYYYMEFAGLSCRDVAARLGTPRSSASYAKRSIERRATQNPTFKKLLKEATSTDLPTEA